MTDNYIVKEKITDTLEKNFMPYAMSVIVSRAIPSIDGLKPSHRKLLYTMYKMGLINGPRTKSANVVGQTMKLNPHGDQAIYETLVRLTKGNESLLLPFIDSKGNFGRVYSREMRYAASRYTEVKLMPICKEMFRDIDKQTVPFEDNYDGTIQEPTLLPSAYPNILVNTSQGIAVGMASNMASFNLKEVCEGAIEYIKDSNVDLIDYIKAPDFSTGGLLLYSRDEIQEIYRTGRGIFKLRGTYTVDKSKRHIEITEIPYTTTAEAIIESIIDLVKSNKVKEISDVRDETDLNGLKITLDIKKNTDIEKLMNKLYLKTPLQDSFGCNFNILINGRPLVLSLKDILKHWVDFRVECITNQLTFDLARNNEKLHLLLGLDRILLDIDDAIKIVRNTEKEDEVVPNLMAAFRIDEVQAEYVAEIKLRYLNREYILKRLDEMTQLKAKIEDIEKTLSDKKRIKKVIINQLDEISKKYGEERKTRIIETEHIEDISNSIEIEDYNLKIFFTKENYFKKIPLTALRTDPEQKIKNSDQFVQEIESTNKTEVIFFSDKANAYKMKMYQIPDCKAGDFGEYLPNLLEMEEGETIVKTVVTDKFEGNMIFGFENGKCSKIPLKSYETVQNRKLLAKAYFGGSNIKYIDFLEENKKYELVAITDKNRALIFSTDDITVKTTRASQGITLVKIRKDETVKEIVRLEESKLKDADKYRAVNIPATARPLSDRDAKRKQISIFDL